MRPTISVWPGSGRIRPSASMTSPSCGPFSRAKEANLIPTPIGIPIWGNPRHWSNPSQPFVCWIEYERELVYQFIMSMIHTSALGRRGGERVRQWLLDMLGSGHYGAGAKLPTERAIAEQLAVPRS